MSTLRFLGLKSDRSLLRMQTHLFSTDDVVHLDRTCLDIVEKFVTPTTIELFGPRDIEETLNLASTIIGLKCKDEDAVIAVMCLNRYPNISAVPSWDWSNWFRRLYQVGNVNPRNTFWIHLFVHDPTYTKFVMYPMIRLIFRMKHIDYVFMVVPPGIQKIDFIDVCATRILPIGHMNPRTVQTLYMLERKDYVKKYKIRRAVEEDNDDLVPLINMYSTRLKEYYGEYYIAEILTRQDSLGRQLIVAEYESVAVAVISMNENVNYDLLNEKFWLVPFNGLRKPTDKDQEPENPKTTAPPPPEPTDKDGNKSQDEKSVADEASCTPPPESVVSDCTSSTESEFDIVFSMEPDVHSQSGSEIDDLDTARKLGEYEEHLLQAHKYYEHHMEFARDVAVARAEYVHLMEDTVLPTYYGGPNAFALEIALAHPDHFPALSHLYEAAFQCFPDRDFCVMSLPFTLTPPVLHTFLFVPPRPQGMFPNSLYLLHRSSVVGNIFVRCSEFADMRSVKNLVAKLPKGQTLFNQYELSLKQPWHPYLSYVMTCDDQIVGLSIVSEMRDIDYLVAHYCLGKWMDNRFHRSGSHGLIESLVICPIFNKYGRYFLSELHRLCDFSVLYYKLTYADNTALRERPLNNALNYMIPVNGRPYLTYDMDYLEEYPPAEYITRKEEPFALYISLGSFFIRKSFEYNSRIVIVGASDSAIGFLEALFSSEPDERLATFHKVTLVCSHPLYRYKIPQKIKEHLFIQTGYDSESALQTASPLTYVNIAYGVMTAINRKDKYITIDDGTYLPYDLLFLMCGEQFQKNSVRPDVESKREFPQNVYIINTESDGVAAFNNLKIMRQQRKGEKIIVYGHFLQAHCCLGTLCAYGIPTEEIIYVEPFPYNASFDGIFRHNVAFYNDPEIDEAILEAIRRVGIKIYHGYYFHDWRYTPADNTITHVKFESENQIIEIKCCALFFYIGKSISPRTFKSIIQAGLVFDGRLIIDTKCRTNDKQIYACGTLTRYARKYDADHLIHKNFNRKEIGYKLGIQIKTMLLNKVMIDHTFKPVMIKKVTDDLACLPKYTKPIVKHCRLPDGLHYLSVRKPGMRIPLEAALSRGDYGHVLVTGDCKNLNKQGFFRLHLNKYKKVETITCLTKFPIEANNIISIYGMHEKLLNNLMLRFDMVLINDFFDYFRQPWAYALYHDRFSKLWAELELFMEESETDDGDKYKDLINQLLTERNWAMMEEEKKVELEHIFKDSVSEKQLETLLIKFLDENEPHLSMYGTPTKIKKMIEE